ncbi:MAG: LAGLIDADG family homing endonuclease [Candidatus Nanohaloarchaea archaeon]|nr:LAGLIDADG family homing endonuclease [Candidatus Nanohaloarchaea archaeon]
MHPEETLYMDGKIWEAGEALKHARENGDLLHQGKGGKVFDIGAKTQTLSPDGCIKQRNCYVYEKRFEGKIYRLRTKTGREIKVTGNHPFLVNRKGSIEWVKARNITEKDFLVAPSELNLPEKNIKSHRDAIEALEDKYTVVSEDQIKEIKHRLKEGIELSREDINALRIASDLSKKEAAEKIDSSYDQVLNYLDGSSNKVGRHLVKALKGEIREETDRLESFKIHKIRDNLSASEAGFIVGFVLSDGWHTENSVEIYQTNLPKKFDRWVELVDEMGLEVKVTEEESGRRAAVKSKPFVDYLDQRYNLREPEKLLSMPSEFKKSFLEIFLLAESHFDSDRNRITFTQKDQDSVNLIAHLLLEFGITPWIADRGRVYRLKIQGEDIENYLEQFEWRGDKPQLEGSSSSHRVTPLDSRLLERLVEYLGVKSEGGMSELPWYNSFRMLRERRDRMANHHLEMFLNDMEERLENRKKDENAIADIHEKARKCGLSITDVVEGTSLTKHRVWQTYSNGTVSKSDRASARHYIEEEYSKRIKQCEKIIQHLKTLTESSVFYDRVKEIESEDYSGTVIGLSVPGEHNYMAGLGCCGINHNTFPLPEAQRDRFMMKVFVDYPSRQEELEIVKRFTSELNYAPELDKIISKPSLLTLQEFARKVPIAEDIKKRAVEMASLTRKRKDLDFGSSPRGSLSLVLAGKARALLKGRSYVSSEDLDKMAKPVLRHRIGVSFEAERNGKTADDIIEEIVNSV